MLGINFLKLLSVGIYFEWMCDLVLWDWPFSCLFRLVVSSNLLPFPLLSRLTPSGLLLVLMKFVLVSSCVVLWHARDCVMCQYFFGRVLLGGSALRFLVLEIVFTMFACNVGFCTLIIFFRYSLRSFA